MFVSPNQFTKNMSFLSLKKKFLETLLSYFPSLNSKQVQQFDQMYALYSSWNAQINVISRKDIAAFYSRHVLHALSIAKFIQFEPDTHVFDVGTGGGFPGIPLAVFFPEVHFHLIDSIGKKIKVVNSVATDLELYNVKTYNQRMEEVSQQADFICCRAVAPMETLVHWVGKKINKTSKNKIKNGWLCLKGGDLHQELKTFPTAQETPLSNYYSDPFFATKKLVYIPQ